MLNRMARLLLALTLGAGVFSLSVAPAQAECSYRKIRKADLNYHNAVRRHGYRSRQAEHWRGERAEERAKCR